MNDEQVNKVKGLAAPVIKVLEGFGWKWTPQVGEWWVEFSDINTKGSLRLIHNIGNVEEVENLRNTNLGQKWIIPILPWEECFEILAKAGFSTQIEYTTGHKSFCTIKRPGLVCADFGSSPTEATYQTILRLGKELK